MRISPLSAHYYSYIRTIKKVLVQQKLMLVNDVKQILDRIVSLPKPYIRPIVRGKENKRVEFEMKVRMMQVDGICIIDKVSFNIFNESKILKMSTIKHKILFRECNQLGADRIYATNQNRRYLTDKTIFTCFPKKGPKSHTKQEEKLRSAIAKERSTVTEGSFWDAESSYGLQKIKAKRAENEVVWMFFGVMTANAVKISKRQQTFIIEKLKQAA